MWSRVCIAMIAPIAMSVLDVRVNNHSDALTNTAPGTSKGRGP